MVAAAAVVLPFAGYAALHKTPVVNAGQVPDGPAESVQPSDSVRAASSVADTATSHQVVAFLGDDYAAGAGASAPAKRFSTILATQLGFTEANFGVNRTGYARVSDAGGDDYDTRVAQVVAAKPTVVIVSGGRNDVIADDATVAAHARQLFADLHSRLPQATIIAIAPWWGDSKPRAALATVAADVKSAVEAAGGTYLDLPDPLFGHPDWMADDADPNDQGYAAIASSLQPAIAAQLGTG